MSNPYKLISTLTRQEFPWKQLEEFAPNGESLEICISRLSKAKIHPGTHLWERFSDFMPFENLDQSLSLGEGNTPLVLADKKLQDFTGLEQLLFKNETQNPTWSFKDRGSLTCVAMAKALNETTTATISTGNMGHSMAAYGAKAGIKVIVFVPDYTPNEKISAMGMHGAQILKIKGNNYSEIKKTILSLAKDWKLRIVSGNGPMRVEGYKMIGFELFEQMNQRIPDYIAVPTSACGHIRGIFKGYRELYQAGIIHALPKMIIVQAKNNSPIVSAIQQRKKHCIPFTHFHTIAEAITTGNPMGGDELIAKAYEYNWLAESVTEAEILEGQKHLAASGYFVEPAAATSLYAIKKLRIAGKIKKSAQVVVLLTGSGLKDSGVLKYHKPNIQKIPLKKIEKEMKSIRTN